jgi:predicted phage replisome organizer
LGENKMAEKRYYWLKLKENYFDSPKIKKLRRVAGGDTYTIIYLKMQLLSISSGGVISFEGIEESFEEELALKLDEQIEDVQLTLAFLKQQSLVEAKDEQYLLVEACNNIGSENSSAERVRKFRENKEKLELDMKNQAKALHCNAGVTQVKQNSISISNSIYNIFNYWNSKDIIKHRELNKEREKALEKALKKYKEEELIKYIERYDMVIKDTTYFFDYKWTLEDFLNRKDGMASFTDEGSKWVSYNNQKRVIDKKDTSSAFEHHNYSKEELNSVFDSLKDVEL